MKGRTIPFGSAHKKDMRNGSTHTGPVKSKAHPGFKAVQSKIAGEQGVSKESAGAILAASSRGASAAAKKANPRLTKVKGN